MREKRRYRLRANSVALSRLQWSLVSGAVVLGVVGLALALTAFPSLGGGLMALAGMTLGVIALSAVGTLR